jgi:hypothetical protein
MQMLPRIALLIALPPLLATPIEAKGLSQKDQERVARAAPEDQDMVADCLRKKKKGAKTGTIAGAATGAGASLIAGGSFGVTALAAGGGAVAGNLIGKGAGTNKTCDDVLKRNK